MFDQVEILFCRGAREKKRNIHSQSKKGLQYLWVSVLFYCEFSTKVNLQEFFLHVFLHFQQQSCWDIYVCLWRTWNKLCMKWTKKSSPLNFWNNWWHSPLANLKYENFDIRYWNIFIFKLLGNYKKSKMSY